MAEIWKYTLQPRTRVPMPKGAKVLCAREQAGNVCIWAEVDPTAPKENRAFEVFGTGHEMADQPRTYIGTVVLSGGALVFHVYESTS